MYNIVGVNINVFLCFDWDFCVELFILIELVVWFGNKLRIFS